MTGRLALRRVILGAIAACVFAVGVTPARGQGLANQPPVIITCDRITQNNQPGNQILLAEGGITIEHESTHARADQAILWIESNQQNPKGPASVTIYGEGNAVLERDGKRELKPKFLITLEVRGDLQLRNNSRRERDLNEEPIYRRAVGERLASVSQNLPSVVAWSETMPQPPAAPIASSPEPPEEPNTVRPALATISPIEPAAEATPRERTIEVIPAQYTLPPESPPPGAPAAPAGPRIPPPRRVQIAPRGGLRSLQAEFRPLPSGEQVAIVTGGVTVFVDDVEGIGAVDLAADRAVVWMGNADPRGMLSGLNQGLTTNDQIEVYLEGHVEIRQADVRGPTAGITRLLLADQVYYDIANNKALLIQAEVITRQPGVPAPIHLRAQEIRQLGPNRFEASQGELFASLLPSDPGLKLQVSNATLEERAGQVPGRFGQGLVSPNTSAPDAENRFYGTADDVVLRFEDFPIFYYPRASGDLSDPMGPLEQVRIRADRIFGFGAQVDLDAFELLGMEAPPNARWRLDADYFSRRGPALGTEYTSAGVGLFGLPGPYANLVRAYGIYDDGKDILGGPRTFELGRQFRGRVLARHRQELAPDWTLLGQLSYLSDRNFLEQYYKREFDEEPNQETFLYLQYQHDNLAASALVEPRLRGWVNETEWWPRVDGYWLGESFFDRLTYFGRASAGYAIFRSTSDLPPGYVETPIPGEFLRTRPLPPSSDFPHSGRVETGRFDLWQELDVPFQLGDVKVVPYGILDITHYTDTLLGDDDTRLYGGPGFRASVPFTRIYPEACSDLFNVNGIAHKIVFDVDYRYMQSSADFRELPELDRLDDDATDQSRRDLRAFRIAGFPPGSNQHMLATSPFFDPQLYAIRRGIETAIDTLDDLQVLRAGVRQRWQTKRGFPGRQHIIDWMTLDLHGTYFPDSDRDNFGHDLAFLEYDYTWHLGDRTTFVSNGWIDPFAGGARVFNAGVFLQRPERMNLYIGYRIIEPVGSEAVILANSMTLSPKWAMTLASSYDFGESQNLGNSLILTRMGSDLQFSLGITYEALRSNFGVNLEVLPILAPRRKSVAVPVGGAFFD